MRQKHLYPISFILIFGAAGLLALSEIISAGQTGAIGQAPNIASAH
jgi:hypothetical protein